VIGVEDRDQLAIDQRKAHVQVPGLRAGCRGAYVFAAEALAMASISGRRASSRTYTALVRIAHGERPMIVRRTMASDSL